MLLIIEICLKMRSLGVICHFTKTKKNMNYSLKHLQCDGNCLTKSACFEEVHAGIRNSGTWTLSEWSSTLAAELVRLVYSRGTILCGLKTRPYEAFARFTASFHLKLTCLNWHNILWVWKFVLHSYPITRSDNLSAFWEIIEVSKVFAFSVKESIKRY